MKPAEHHDNPTNDKRSWEKALVLCDLCTFKKPPPSLSQSAVYCGLPLAPPLCVRAVPPLSRLVWTSSCCRGAAREVARAHVGRRRHRWESFSPRSTGTAQTNFKVVAVISTVQPRPGRRRVGSYPRHHLTAAGWAGRGQLPVWFQAGFPSVCPSAACLLVTTGWPHRDTCTSRGMCTLSIAVSITGILSRFAVHLRHRYQNFWIRKIVQY